MKKASLFLTILLLACSVMAQTRTNAPAGKSQQKAASGQSADGKQTGATETAKPADKKEEDCGCETKNQPPDVLAIVNGVKIMIKDIDEPIKDALQRLQNAVVEARKRELDLQINSRLLEAEAKKRAVPSAKIIDQEVVAKTKEPTEAEAQAFYAQNKDRINGEFNNVKDQIIAYLREQRQSALAKALADRLRATAQIKVLAQEVTPPKTEADRARVLATVNGERITSNDIEESLLPIIFEVQEKMHEARKQQLDMKINDVLLEQEAQKKQVTTTALFDAEVKQRAKPVTEEDAKKFYEERKADISGTYEQRKAQIVQYLEARERNRAEGEFAEQLRKSAAVQVFLTEPDPPVLKIATDDQPSRGLATAPVTIVEFTDYECPSCARTQPLLEEIAKEYGDKVRLVSRDFPLDQHAHAFEAAEAAEAAREQGKYWEYVALLFNNQQALGIEKLKEYASQLGLDRKRFDQALDSGKFADQIKRDLVDGRTLGVDATPTVFINGKRIRDKSRESLKSAIEAALKNSVKK